MSTETKTYPTNTTTNNTTAVDSGPLRGDGLSVAQAVRTIEYVASKHRVRLQRVGPGGAEVLLRGTARVHRCRALQAAMAVHGFRVRVSGDPVVGSADAVVEVEPNPGAGADWLWNPVDAETAAEERERLAGLLADRAGEDAFAEARELGGRREPDDAHRDAADQEYRFCMQQTLGFLQDRYSRTPVLGRAATEEAWRAWVAVEASGLADVDCVWRDLEGALRGDDGDVDTVEVYAYPLLPPGPLAPELTDQEAAARGREAAANLTKVLRRFLDLHPDHDVVVDDALDVDHVPSFVHRVAVRVVKPEVTA